MQAAVYLGNSQVAVQTVPTPEIGPGEVLIRVESCGICHTDLKKVEYNLLPPPRIYGHETAGVIAATGAGVTKYAVGDRVIVFHHIPCGNCFYCQRQLFAQCPVYKKVGVTAGFEPAGGGFAQYVRVMDWIVERGIEKIPAGVSFDQACWVEPVNTCVKGVELLGLNPNDTVAILGQGPIGLIFTMLVNRKGAQRARMLAATQKRNSCEALGGELDTEPVLRDSSSANILASDTLPYRRELSRRFGAASFDPRDAEFERAVKQATEGRGADAVIVATNAQGLVDQALKISRPGAKVLLFAQTSVTERIEISGADVCVGERILLGSYSADVNLQAESARLVFSGELPLEQLISHCVPLSDMTAGIAIAQRPSGQSLKVVVHPQETN
jgi:L-iditol 2-dehydrogenase